VSERAGRVWHLVTFAVAVFALVFQLVLILRGDSVLDEANAPGTPEAVRRYFFYFTIQANALVAFTSWLVATRDIGSSACCGCSASTPSSASPSPVSCTGSSCGRS
jgi:hypothetical protein